MNPQLEPSFVAAILLKTAFHPEVVRRAQAALIYAAFSGESFTADEVLTKDLIGEDTTVSGIAIGSLASMKLLMRVGRCKSPAPSRNGCYVNRWMLAYGKQATARTWLTRNGFAPAAVSSGQLALA